MSSLFKLPDALCVQIFSVWCDERCLGIFDSAICNRKFRFQFLQTISLSYFILNPAFCALDKKEYIDWICLRGIKPNSLMIKADLCHSNDFQNSIGYLSKSVDSLVISDKKYANYTYNNNQISKMINMFPLLVSLSLCLPNHNADAIFQAVEPKILSKLKGLDVAIHKKQMSKVLATYCTNLTVLVVENDYLSNEKKNDLHNLIQANGATLLELTVDSDSELLLGKKLFSQVKKHCKVLDKILCDAVSNTELSDITQLYIKCEKLTLIDIKFYTPFDEEIRHVLLDKPSNSLYLNNINCFQDNAAEFFETLINFEVITVDNVLHITDKEIDTITQYNQYLKVFKIIAVHTDISYSSMEALIRSNINTLTEVLFSIKHHHMTKDETERLNALIAEVNNRNK